jgi:C_GCAxxG_C_C family probable redox protein
MNKVADAARRIQDGCACSQAVLSAYAESLGISEQTALRIASGFGGGMRMGETCGVVTGAFMVIGLRYAADNCSIPEGRAEVCARVLEFVERFRGRNGSILCRELLGCDISTPDGLKKAQELNLLKTTCVKLVKDAVTILEDMETGNENTQ